MRALFSAIVSCFLSEYSWLSIHLQFDEQLGAVVDGHLLADLDHQAGVGSVLVRRETQHCPQHQQVHCQTHRWNHFDFWSPSGSFDVSLIVSTSQRDGHLLFPIRLKLTKCSCVLAKESRAWHAPGAEVGAQLTGGGLWVPWSDRTAPPVCRDQPAGKMGGG